MSPTATSKTLATTKSAKYLRIGLFTTVNTQKYGHRRSVDPGAFTADRRRLPGGSQYGATYFDPVLFSVIFDPWVHLHPRFLLTFYGSLV